MANKNRKGNIHKKRMKLVMLILLVFFVWSGYTSYQQWIKIQQKKEKIEALQVQEKEALKKKQDLEKQIMMLQKDDYIAELARKYYFLSKPGEYIFIPPQQ